MRRLLAFALAFAAVSFAVPTAAVAAPAPAPVPAASQPGDLYTVNNVRVDATAESAQTARDAAMAQGRPQAWTRVYRRLTPQAMWARQPRLADAQLFRLIRSFEVVGERRSTTRYLADVTFHFNPVAVRQALRQAGISFTEARSRPALVIPVVDDGRFDPMSMWAAAWGDDVYRQGLVPMILPDADAENAEVLSRPDLAQADWASLTPIAQRYGASLVVIAIASADGRSVRSIEVSATSRTPSSFAFAQSNFPALADAVTDKVAEAWKSRSSVDYATRARLVADVQFNTLEEWSRIRTQLGAVRAVSDFEIVGLARNEAEVDLSYFGRVEQLRDAMAQQNLTLVNGPEGFTLQLGGATADIGR